MATQTHSARQALIVWGIFFIINVIVNGTIPFIMGTDMHTWKSSTTSNLLYGLVQYGIMFLVVPMILVKGWQTARQPAFLFPLILAVLAITFSLIYRGIMAFALLIIIYLHFRFDLSDIGIRLRGGMGDIIAILIIGLLYAVPSLMDGTYALDWASALFVGMDRWFANPASSVENMFYFGFLTERLFPKTGRLFTPLLIGAMYTAHEMTNPGYWYRGMNFSLVFIGIAVCTSVYLWRRSVVIIWFGDGLSRLIGKLF